jgi:hypothetical protein
MATGKGPTVDSGVFATGLSKYLEEFLVGSRLETSLSFKYAEVTTVKEYRTGVMTIPIGDSCEFFVNSIFYNTIDYEKKARLRRICQLLFQMKLLKTNEGGRFLSEMYDFIESTEQEQNLGKNPMFINMHSGYLGQVLKTDGSGYFVNKEEIREWCIELADIIGTVITRLSNRKRVIHTRGITHVLGEPIEDMYRHSLVWEWSYITIREDRWFTKETAQLIKHIAPHNSSLSSPLCLRF